MPSRTLNFYISLTAVLLFASVPMLAYAQDLAPVTGALNAIHGFMQSTAIRTLAAIAVIGLGITAILGRLRWVPPAGEPN